LPTRRPPLRPSLLALTALLCCAHGSDGPSGDKGDGDDGPRYATSFTMVTVDPATPASMKLLVQACAGLENRALGGSVLVRFDDTDELWLDELGLSPAATLSADDFVASCQAEIPSCVRYDYDTQHELLPSILTAASALGALPMDVGLGLDCNVVVDATAELQDKTTQELATRWAFERYAADTTGLAMLNPGYDANAADRSDPPLTSDMGPQTVDFVFSERLFVLFLVNGCQAGDPENLLLDEIVNAGNWPLPLGVYGYNDSWLIGGYLHEAQTRCLDSRNMGAIPSKTVNLSFYSTRRAPIVEPGELTVTPPEEPHYDPEKTYVAFIVGDGDNVDYIMHARGDWMRQRLVACAADEGACAPLTWSISPHLPHLAPDLLEWYAAAGVQTGADYFSLPPSGHLYAYPSSMSDADQDLFVTATEQDAAILGTHSTVHWDWNETWAVAEQEFLPKYAEQGVIQGIIPVNVPYLIDAFPDWPEDRYYEVLGGTVVLFRPRQWRGIDDSDSFFLSPEHMAEELVGYPPGTVTAIYLTSDGGLSLDNSVYPLIDLLPDTVQLVSSDAAAKLALEASGLPSTGARSCGCAGWDG
jgi:hypothetical protein